jgi:hypothetical protein
MRTKDCLEQYAALRAESGPDHERDQQVDLKAITLCAG